MLTVFLCSIGRRVELTRHFVNSVRRLAPEGSRVVGLDLDPLAPALRFADQAILVPPVNSPMFVEVIESLIDECRGGRALFVPLSDREVSILGVLADRFQSPDVQFCVVPSSASTIVEDKWATMQFFQEIGLPTPKSWLPGVDLRSLQYPIFIKPRRGSAGEGGRVVADPKEAALALEDLDFPIIQQLMTGNEITTDVVASLDGRFLSCVSRRRLQVRSGEVVKSITVRSPQIETACRSIVEALRPRGPITVQSFESTTDGHCFSEINGRLGGGSPLAIAAGVPITDLLVLDAIGADVPRDLTFVEGLSMSRYDESLFFTKEELDAVQDRDLRSR